MLRAEYLLIPNRFTKSLHNVEMWTYENKNVTSSRQSLNMYLENKIGSNCQLEIWVILTLLLQEVQTTSSSKDLACTYCKSYTWGSWNCLALHIIYTFLKSTCPALAQHVSFNDCGITDCIVISKQNYKPYSTKDVNLTQQWEGMYTSTWNERIKRDRETPSRNGLHCRILK